MKVLDGVATISPRGTKRLKGGHPWIFRSDIVDRPRAPAGIIRVESARGEPLGWALWSPDVGDLAAPHRAQSGAHAQRQSGGTRD